MLPFVHLALQSPVVPEPPAEVGLNGYLLFYTVFMLGVVMSFVLYMTRQHGQVVKDAQKTVQLVSENHRRDNEEKDRRLDSIELTITNHDRATSEAVRIVEGLPQYIKTELNSTQNALLKEILESRSQTDQKLAAAQTAIVNAVADKVNEHLQPVRQEITAHYTRLVEDVVKTPEPKA